MHRVFLSHSSKDKDFVQELYRRLTRDGVNCFFDAESIGWGDNWVRTLERALDECSDIVFVLSPDFCNSEWAQAERTSCMADNASGLQCVFRPLLLAPCSYLDTFPRLLRQVQTIDVSTPLLFERNYPRICTVLGGTVVPEVSTLDRGSLPPVHPLPARHRMPYRSLGNKFFGRIYSLWQIYDALHQDSTAIIQGVSVVAGTGGLGKTQMAIEYVHRFGASYPGGVYWVDSDRGLSTLITQVSECGELSIDTKADEEKQLAQVWRELNKLPACLLVLDNFPEEGAVRPYLPTTGRIHCLVTTRRTDLSQFPNVRLNVLSGEAGRALLNSGDRQLDRDQTDELVERLGGLPLALELVKSFLNYRKDATVRQVLVEMGKSGDVEVLRGFAETYRDKLPSGHETDVARTFQMSWDLAPVTAQNILRTMAELAPVGVPRELIREVLDLPKPGVLKDVFAESISELSRLSLIEFDNNNNPLMHRLIHAFVRYRNQIDRLSYFEPAVNIMLNVMAVTFQEPGVSALRSLELLLPHAEAVRSVCLTPEDAIGLLSRVGKQHQHMGRFGIARNYFAAALEKIQECHEADHPLVATGQSNLALVLYDLGLLEEARDLLEKALASDERSFESGNPYIARSQSNLAIIFRDLGQLREARNLLQRALASYESIFKAGHPSIAATQSNLGLVLRDLGQLEEAREMLQQVLSAEEKSFELGHPSIALSQSNLALVLQDLGQLGDAYNLLRQALAADEKIFEPGHPSIARSQSNLAMVLKDLRRLEEARDLLQKALAAFEKFAPTHQHVPTVRVNLARVLRELGQNAVADQL